MDLQGLNLNTPIQAQIIQTTGANGQQTFQV